MVKQQQPYAYQIQKKLSRAMNLQQQGQLDKAEKLYRAILKKHPDHSDALHLYGLVANQKGRTRQAIDYIGRAIGSNPSTPAYYFNLGVILHGAGEFEKAATVYEKALALQPENAAAWDNLGVTLQQTGNYQAAVEAHRKAVSLNAVLHGAWSNLGESFRKQGLFDDAIPCYQKALELAPDFANASSNLGNVYRETGQLDKALDIFARALAKNKADDSSLAEIHWNQAITFLLQGRFREGWIEYEWGIVNGERDVREYPYAVWDGSDLSSKHLLVIGEQGVGDEILFAACIKDAIQQADAVTFACESRLAPLFERSFPGLRTIAAGNVKAPGEITGDDIDCQIAIGSLPRIYRNHESEFSGHSGYLLADEEKFRFWKQRYQQLGDGLKVGISWRGGSKSEDRHKRSTNLMEWRPIFSVKPVHFINLQYGECSEELRLLEREAGVIVHDWEDADPLKDLDGFAAQVAALDLVISIDNSAAHMAGALGIPVWTLLPLAADWRWQRDRTDTPWFPSMVLLRQFESGNWKAVFERASVLLQGRVDGNISIGSRLPENAPKAVLLNDTSAWYHWGCTCTSSALIEELRNIGFSVSTIPAHEINDVKNTPAHPDDFDAENFYQTFASCNRSIVQRIANADVVVTNGEGTLYDLTVPSLNLLYLAYISKTRLGKPAHIINHSCYPEGRDRISDAEKNDLYKKVYRCMDSIAIREGVSARLLEQLGLDVIHSFDCLPLYIRQQNILPVERPEKTIVIAGSVAWDESRLPDLADYMRVMAAQGYRIKVITGARAFPAQDDIEFTEALSAHSSGDWELIHAESANEWLHTISNAILLVSGRFHHTIAAAFMKTPAICLNSNTPKMDGMLSMSGQRPPILYSSDKLSQRLVTTTQELIDHPENWIVSDSILSGLVEKARDNFLIIREQLETQSIPPGDIARTGQSTRLL